MRPIWRVCLTGCVLVLVVLPTIGPSAMARQRFSRLALPYASSADYVCQVFLLPPGASPASGSFGTVQVRFYTLPNCTGDFVGEGKVFSQGATHEDASPSFLVSEAMLHTYFLMLQRAAGTGQKVNWIRCDDTKRNCLQALGALGGDTPVR